MQSTSRFGKTVLALLRPEEWTFLLFLALLAALVTFVTPSRFGWQTLADHLVGLVHFSIGARHVFGSHLAFFVLLLLLYPAAMALIWVATRRRTRTPGAWRPLGPREVLVAFRDYLPFLFCYAVYALLRSLVPALHPRDFDPELAALDKAMFGGYSFVWVRKTLDGPVMGTLLSWCYGSHFYVAPLAAFAFYVARRRGVFRDLMLSITLSSFLGFAGYLAFPVRGPQYFYVHWNELGNGDATLARFVSEYRWMARDCFPSLHAAWTVVVAWFLWRGARAWFWAYLPVAVGLHFGTLYFGWHYFPDLPAGWATAAASILLASRWNRWWYAHVNDLVAGRTGR